MEQRFSAHGHTRSMSSLASTILSIPSDPSYPAKPPFLRASSVDLQAIGNVPLELSIPLPPSRTGSPVEVKDEEPRASAGSAGHPPPEDMDQTPQSQDSFLERMDGSPKPDATTAVRTWMPLEQIKALVMQEDDYTRRINDLRERLEHLRLSCGLDRRMIHISDYAYRSLVSNFQNIDQTRFLEIYDTVQHIANATQSVSFSGETSSVNSYATAMDSASRLPNWMDLLPANQRGTIIRFLHKIRLEPDYVAECLLRMPPAELIGLTSTHDSANVPESILPGRASVKAQRPSKDPRFNAQTARLRSCGQDDPIFALLYSVFDVSLGFHSWEYHQRTEVWATACAKIMVSGRRGSDELLTMALEAFAGLQEWTLKPRLESYIQEVLRKGAFLLELPNNQATDFGESVETRNAKAAVSASNFFESSLEDLFTLLAENLPLSIPPSLLDLVRNLLGKIKNPKIRSRAETFVVSKWFFCSFVSNALVHPEAHGMLMTQHIGNTARTVILKEMAVCMQKQIFDISSPWNFSLVSSDSQTLIEQVFASFKPSNPLESGSADQLRLPAIESQEQCAFLVLSPRDLVSLIQALHSPSIGSRSSGGLDHQMYSGNASTASSVAESSTLTSGSTGYGSGVTSSMTPSISGTSMTSATVLSEAPFQDPGSQGLESMEFMPDTTVESAKQDQGETEEAFETHLMEACQTLRAMNEADHDVHSTTRYWDWAAISICNDRDGLDTLPNLHTEAHQAFYNPSLQGRSGAIVLQGYQDLEAAIVKSLNDEHGSLNIRYVQAPRFASRASDDDRQSVLDLNFQSSMASCQASFDFRGAHFWWTNLQTLRSLKSNGLSGEAFNNLLAIIAARKQSAVEVESRIVMDYEGQLCRLEQLERRQNSVLMATEGQRKALRLKMWYVCDVKHSAMYEDALGITRALKAMTDNKRSKRSSGVTSWARHRLRTPLSQDKSATHVLEALVAPRDNGGPAKLADQQIELTSRWLTRNSVENFCKGEERIHRFCHEVQRCANRLAGMDMLESPVLWSSALFKHEKASFDMDRRYPASGPWREGQKGFRSSHWSSGMPQAPPSPVSPTNPSAPLYGLGLHSSTSMNEFWKPSRQAQTTAEPNGYEPWNSPVASGAAPWPPPIPYGFASSFPSMLAPPGSVHKIVGTCNIGPSDSSETRKDFISTVKEAVSSLLLSDLGYLLWNQGSETDLWVSKSNERSGVENQSLSRAVPQTQREIVAASSSLGQAQLYEESMVQPKSDSHDLGISPSHADDLSDATITIDLHEEHSTTNILRSQKEAAGDKDQGTNNNDVPQDRWVSRPSFPFSDAYATILDRLSSSHNPYTKLDLLLELETLAVQSIDDTRRLYVPPQPSRNMHFGTQPTNTLSSRGINVPRTQATSLEEVIANCTERRAGTLRFTTAPSAASPPSTLSTLFQPPSNHPISTDEIVETLLSIFRDDALRPPTLYRDLQFIAAHIPSPILDRTARGKAFWDAGLAALALKEERISAMIARATRITTYHISATKADSASFTSSYAPDLVNTTLTDAAHLWTIAAKEGSPVAARELALFYLTHPELVPRVTMPLSKGKDVFRTVGASEKGVDRGGLDPLTFAVVFHWMEVAASGGDKDARDFLRGTGDLSGGR